MNASKNRMSSSEKLDDPSDHDSSPTRSSPLEHVPESRCPCCSSYGANDETDIWQDDHHASHDRAATGVTKQTVESIERSLVEGHVTSRFPVSFARTRLAPAHGHGNGAKSLSLSASKHCIYRTSNLRSAPEIALAHSNGTGSNPVLRSHTGGKVKEVVICRRRRVSYLVQETVSTVDRSRHNISRTGGALTSYSRVST
jgi:hypothetical protein